MSTETIPDYRRDSEDLERALVGGALLEMQLFRRMPVTTWPAEMFRHPLRRAVWRSILEQAEKGEGDANVMYHAERALDLFDADDKPSGTAIRNEMVSCMEATTEGDVCIDEIGRALEREGLARKLRTTGKRLVRLAEESSLLDGSSDIDAVVGPLLSKAHAITNTEPKSLAEYIDLVAKRAHDRPIRRECGVRSIDAVAGGLIDGSLTTIAARPGKGKTTYAVHVAERFAATTGQSAGVVTLEQGGAELASILMSSKSEVPQSRFLDARMSSDDWERFLGAAGNVAALPIMIREPHRFDWPHVRAEMQSLIDAGCGLVIVDYLQLIEGDRKQKRNEQLSTVTREMKLLAKRTSIRVIECAQLNRGLDKDRKRVPVFADLKDTGSIEQDSDMIIFLHDPGSGEEHSGSYEILDVVIAKNRSGKTGTTRISWDKPRRRYLEPPPYKQLAMPVGAGDEGEDF